MSAQPLLKAQAHIEDALMIDHELIALQERNNG